MDEVSDESSELTPPSTLEVMLCRRLEKKPPDEEWVPPLGTTSVMKDCPMREVLSCGSLAGGESRERRTDGQDGVVGQHGRLGAGEDAEEAEDEGRCREDQRGERVGSHGGRSSGLSWEERIGQIECVIQTELAIRIEWNSERHGFSQSGGCLVIYCPFQANKGR
jgi:hypothetical protein